MQTPTAAARIGDYEVLETLGTGSTGKVKLGRHVVTGQLVAMKTVRHNLLDTNPSMYEKVRRETAVLTFIAASCQQLRARASPAKYPPPAQRQSPQDGVGVMHLLDVLHFDNAVVLILEYCPGGELFDVLLHNGFLRPAVVLDYFQQLVHALQFCHARGICHRDLKPENILLTEDGRLKVADFGMSAVLFPGQFLQSSCGSPQYCAPEVLLGELYHGSAADVWSLGVILFTMTTGGLPFDDDNFHRLYKDIQSASYYMPPEVPPPIASVIRSMLVADPEQRATLDDIVATPWFQSCASRPDVYRERHDWNNMLKASLYDYGEPIDNPDATVLKHLADLGLGNILTIRRRLLSGHPCKEREYYKLLSDFCRDMYAYRDARIGGAGDDACVGNSSAESSLDDLFAHDSAVAQQAQTIALPMPHDPHLLALVNAVADTTISPRVDSAWGSSWTDAASPAAVSVASVQRDAEASSCFVNVLSR